MDNILSVRAVPFHQLVELSKKIRTYKERVEYFRLAEEIYQNERKHNLNRISESKLNIIEELETGTNNYSGLCLNEIRRLEELMKEKRERKTKRNEVKEDKERTKHYTLRQIAIAYHFLGIPITKKNAQEKANLYVKSNSYKLYIEANKLNSDYPEIIDPSIEDDPYYKRKNRKTILDVQKAIEIVKLNKNKTALEKINNFMEELKSELEKAKKNYKR